MHQEHLQFLRVMDQELIETIGQKVSCGLVRAIPDGWLWDRALKSSAYSGVDTLLLSPPGITDLLEPRVVMSFERLSSLLYYLLLVQWS